MTRRLYICLILFASSCGNKDPGRIANQKADSILYPYAPIYTTSFERGNPVYSRTVLEVWKEFETGNVTHLATKFADSLTLVFPDKFLTGKRDSVLQLFQRRRTAYIDVQCYVDAWEPVHVRERNEDLVFIWGRQDGTAANGKRLYRVIHEIWRFDTAGKIKRMEQYITHPY